MESIEIKEKELNVFGCSNCGSELKYKPGTKTLVCEYCNTKNEIQQEESVIEELSFNDYLEKSEAENLEIEKIIHCNNCGASSSIDENLKSLHCPYCNSPLVQKDVQEERFIKPSHLLPFNLDNSKVSEILVDWIDGLWWTPNNLRKAAISPLGLKGVYVPYWTFDTSTYSRYTGERGENYEISTGNGNNETTETKTRWFSTSGNVSVRFDDIMSPASENIDLNSLTKLEPWDTNYLIKVNDQYLSGFVTEKYKIKLKEAFQTVKKDIDKEIKYKISRDIGGDKNRIDSVNTEYKDIYFKHILLPVYVSSYQYNNKTYHFYVNGRNGKLVGNRPYSTVKIVLAIIVALLLIIIIL